MFFSKHPTDTRHDRNCAGKPKPMRDVRHLIDATVYWFCVPASGGALLTFGQSEVLPPWLANSSTLTGTVVLAWFAWHTVTKTIPEMQRTFREEMALERAAHDSELAAKDMRHEREIAEWRGMLAQAMQSDRKAVHDMKDTAALVIAKSELKAKQ
jgi:hypothetical protein